MEDTKRPKAIDLFAGPGGLSLGLVAAGFQVIGAIEMDEDAGKTYRWNIGSHTSIADITKYKPKKFRKHLEEEGLLEPGENPTLVAGGPPCPGFSLIGRSKISDLIKKGEYGDSKDFRHRFVDDPRNDLFKDFVKYVREFKPHYFIMENVSGMSSYQIEDDPIVDVIKRAFRGYNVQEKILCASDYGVPQDRKRIIFLGHRKSEHITPCEFPKKTNLKSHLTTLDAIRDLAFAEPTTDGRVRVSDISHNSAGGKFRRQIRDWNVRRPDGSEVSSTGGWKTNHWTRTVNARDTVIFPHINSGAKGVKRGSLTIPDSRPRQIYGDLFPSRWNDLLAPEFEEAGLETWEKDERHHVGISGGKSWVMYLAKNFKDKMRRIRWNKPAPTIVAHLAKDGYMFIHPWMHRTITVREAARFQSFPDTFDFSGGPDAMNSMTSQFRQVGNAVPPLLAKALGEEIIKALRAN